MSKEIRQTIETYEAKASGYIRRYDSAEMSALHRLLLRELPEGGRILDIGFGSGRDLAFLLDRSFKIWGVDPVSSFVENAKRRFPDLSDRFTVAGLPEFSLPPEFPERFDGILLIAVWMHIPREFWRASARRIVSLLRPGGKIVLSYSLGERGEDGRLFERIDAGELHSLFEEEGCHLVSSTGNEDSLGRDGIRWITEVYERC